MSESEFAKRSKGNLVRVGVPAKQSVWDPPIYVIDHNRWCPGGGNASPIKFKRCKMKLNLQLILTRMRKTVESTHLAELDWLGIHAMFFSLSFATCLPSYMYSESPAQQSEIWQSDTIDAPGPPEYSWPRISRVLTKNCQKVSYSSHRVQY